MKANKWHPAHPAQTARGAQWFSRACGLPLRTALGVPEACKRIPEHLT